MAFALTPKQHEAIALLSGPATHILLRGGSRSGKTFLLMRAIMIRALARPNSRHAVLRFRFNHVVTSIVHDTLPKVVDLCWPGLANLCKLDKSLWYYKLPNGSEIWFGGLDEKERTEKILGQEYSTIFLNECSQIPWASRNMALTRLAQNAGLRLKMFLDCNPPSDQHWTAKLFMRNVDPDTNARLPASDAYATMVVNPVDNSINLDPQYLKELDALPARMRRRFYLGEYTAANDNALWTMEVIDRCYVDGKLPDMLRTIIAVDPSGCAGQEDKRSDEIGIVVCGLGIDGKGYVIEDLSGHYGPSQWGNIIATAFDRHAADCVVAETNFGGAMVAEIVKTSGHRMPFREVKASRGKAVRAEPVSVLFEQGKVMLAGRFLILEDQLCSMTTAGYMGDKSPDRADAMVWGLTHLFPAVTKPDRIKGRPPSAPASDPFALDGYT